MMKYSTYILLIGATQACTNQDIVDKSAANASEMQAMTALTDLKTADVATFETELLAAQDHVNEMIGDEKIAKVGSDQEKITAAETNRKTAELLLSQLLEKDGNAAKNKILVDIASQAEKVGVAETAYKRALNSCVPPETQEWIDQQIVALKTEKDYDNLEAADKLKLDEMVTLFVEKQTEKMADVKDAADYDEMDDANKAMFDKLLLAQWTVQKEEMDAMDKKINMGGKSQAEWDAMTDEEKEKAKGDMQDMREMFMGKQKDRGMGEFQMRKDGDYFKMDKDQQDLFDEKLGEKRGRMNDQMKGMVSDFNSNKKDMSGMTDDQKKEHMGEMMDMMKMKGSRDQEFENHDFQQRMKMGYFDKMSSNERANYDEKDKKLRDDRNECQGGMDNMMMQMKKDGGFDNMGKDDKKNFQGMAMFQMGSNMQSMMKDREEDDDMRKRMGYFKQDQAGRDKVDQQVDFMKGKRTQERMPVMEGESKSVCYPSQYHDGDGYRGGKGGKMHDEDDDDMMGKMMKDGMKDDDGEGPDGMMKKGMHGMGGMMDKMNGMEGMLDKMANMDSKDKEEMMNKLKNMKDGDMQGMMKGGMDGVKEGVQQMMKEKMHGMMEMGEKEDMMSKMGGKEGMMNMMCMTGGKDKDGNDMKKKFEGMMEKKKGQSHEPPSGEKIKEMEGKGEKPAMFNGKGGCAETLCCGHILTYGVWQEDYFCYDQWSQTTEDGYRFSCVEGMAKNLVAATMSIAAAVLMMQ